MTSLTAERRRLPTLIGVGEAALDVRRVRHLYTAYRFGDPDRRLVFHGFSAELILEDFRVGHADDHHEGDNEVLAVVREATCPVSKLVADVMHRGDDLPEIELFI